MLYKCNLIIKKILAILMCTLILSFSVFSSVAKASDFSTSANAYGFLWELFLSLGSTVLLTTGCIDGAEEFTDIDVAQFGADFMVEKMGLDVETANIVSDFLTPNKYNNDFVILSEDAATAYLNGTVSIGDLKTNSVDGAFTIYMNNLFDEIETGIASFVDDVVSGFNELALNGHVFIRDDIGYSGELDNIEINKYNIIWANVDASGNYAYYTSCIEHDEGVVIRPYVFKDAYGAASLMYFANGVPYAPNVTGYNIRTDGSRVEIGSFKISGAYVDTWQSFSVNVPIFTDEIALEAYRVYGDDSGCINQVESLIDFENVWDNFSSTLSSFVSRGAYNSSDLYNTLTDVYSNLSDNAITDSSIYVDAVSAALDALPTYDTDFIGNDVKVDVPVIDSDITIEKPSSDAELLEWVKYIADSLSMSWTWGSDIPEILVDIGEHVQDIPSVLDGLEEGVSDVVDVGNKTWQKVAEIPDIIDFSVDDILAGLSDFSDVVSVPLGGVLEGVNSHTGILEDIKTNVLDFPNTIASSFENVIADVKDLILSLPDYTGLLEKIIAILEAILAAINHFIGLWSTFFFIDFTEIYAHIYDATEAIPAFDGFEPVLGYIDDFRGSIGDGYDYPVISIQTPDILLPYYKQPEIILCDFEDYAKYFIWVRAFLSFSISFGFGLWFVNDIKKFFSQL